MSAPLILDQLEKSFGPAAVPVRQISLRVEPGEFLTLLGPSGCGKSTVLRLIAGLERPDRGRIRIGDRDVTDLPPGDRDVAMVFQSYALYPHLSVAENLASPLRLRRLANAEIQQRIEDVAQRLDLGHLLHRRPAQLSGGQRQRVALGRALVRQPAVFLLDEPLSNLDALLREQVRDQLRQVFEGQDRPVVYVTHDQTEALSLSHRIAVLHDGILQQLDRPQQLYHQPVNRFVAGFLGSPRMNFLDLPVDQGRARWGDLGLPIPRSPGNLVTLGLRPEQLSADGTEPLQITAQVERSESLGLQDLVHLRDEQHRPLRVLLRAGRQQPGDRLRIGFRAEACHWFDPSSGQRL